MNRSIYGTNTALNNGKSLYLFDDVSGNNNIKNNQSLSAFANAFGAAGGVGNFTNINVPSPLDINDLIVLNTGYFQLISGGSVSATPYLDIGGDIIFYNNGNTTVMAPNDGTYPFINPLQHQLILTGTQSDSVILQNDFEQPNSLRVYSNGTQITKLNYSIQVLGSSTPSDPNGIYMQGMNYITLSDTSVGIPPEEHLTVASSTNINKIYLDISKLGTFFDSDVSVKGDVNVLGNLGVTGDVGITGGNLSITGDVGVTGNFGLTGGNVSITGNLGVTGNVGVMGNLGVTGDVNVLGNLGVTGDIGLIGNLGITGNAFITGNLGVTGNFGIGGDIFLTGNMGMTGNFGLTGGNMNITGNFGVTGNVDIIGYTSITGDIGMTGDFSIIGNIGVTGDVNITGTLTAGSFQTQYLYVDNIFPFTGTQISMVGDVGITGGNFGFTGAEYYVDSNSNIQLIADNGVLVQGTTGVLILGTNVLLGASGSMLLQTNLGATALTIQASTGVIDILSSVSDININSANDLNLTAANDLNVMINGGFLYSGGDFGITGTNILSLTAPDTYINGINDVFIDAPLIGLTGYFAITGDIGMTGTFNQTGGSVTFNAVGGINLIDSTDTIQIVGNDIIQQGINDISLSSVGGDIDLTSGVAGSVNISAPGVAPSSAINLNSQRINMTAGLGTGITGDVDMNGDFDIIGNIGVTGDVNVTGTVYSNAINTNTLSLNSLEVDYILPKTATQIYMVGDIGITGGTLFRINQMTNIDFYAFTNFSMSSNLPFSGINTLFSPNGIRLQIDNFAFPGSTTMLTLDGIDIGVTAGYNVNIQGNTGINLFAPTPTLAQPQNGIYMSSYVGVTGEFNVLGNIGVTGDVDVIGSVNCVRARDYNILKLDCSTGVPVLPYGVINYNDTNNIPAGYTGTQVYVDYAVWIYYGNLLGFTSIPITPITSVSGSVARIVCLSQNLTLQVSLSSGIVNVGQHQDIEIGYNTVGGWDKITRL